MHLAGMPFAKKQRMKRFLNSASLVIAFLMVLPISVSADQKIQITSSANDSYASIHVLSKAVTLKGALKQGGLIRGTITPRGEVFFDGKVLTVTPSGQFVFGFGRDAVPENKLDWVINRKRYQATLIIQPQTYDIQRISGMAESKVNPSTLNIQRAQKEAMEVEQARGPELTFQDAFEDFVWPLTGPITGVYGSQRVLNNVPKQPHFGVDIAAPVGTLAYAPAGGKVTLTNNDMFYSGGTLIIDHGYGVSSTFLHLSKILVKKGDLVKQGDAVAEVGATGRVSGPHLDWRMNWRNERIDPTTLVPLMKK